MFYAMTTLTFGEWLMKELSERGMSQADLAHAASVSRASISDVLSGRRKVGKDLAISISNGLHLPKEQVFRAAGFLDQKKNFTEEVEQIIHEVDGLPKDEQREILSYIRWKNNARKK